jgi:hypothetical protein
VGEAVAQAMLAAGRIEPLRGSAQGAAHTLAPA